MSPLRMLIKNLGLQTEVNEISKKEKFLRKKYIGVFRWESSKVRMMIVRFPVTLSTYMSSKKKKITTCTSGLSVRPRRMKSVKDVRFFISVVDFSEILLSKSRKTNICLLYTSDAADDPRVV